MFSKKIKIFIKCFLLLVLLIWPIRTFASTNPTNKVADIELCFEKYNYYLNINIDSAGYFAQQAGKIAYEIRDFEDLSKSLAYQGIVYQLQGNLESSMKILLLALELENHLGKPNFKTSILQYIGRIFFDLENYEKSEQYLLMALNNLKIQKDKKHPGAIINYLATIYANQNKTEKALAHFRQALKIGIAYKDTILIASCYSSIGYIFFETNKVDSAEILFKKAIPLQIKINSVQNLANTYFYLGSQRLIDNKLSEAENYFIQVQNLIEETGSDLLRIELYTLLSEVYKKKKDFENALYYSQLMITWKDSVHNKEMIAAVNELSIRYETNLLTQEYELIKKDLDIKSIALSNSRLLQFIFIIISILTILIGFIIFLRIRLEKKINKLSNIRREEQLKQRMLELELKALRVQMNPHFIFNCLSSIRNCVEQKRLDKAENYLSKFAKLLRKMLIISENPEVILKDELEYLGLYLDMEKMRFGDKFDYSFIIDEKVDLENISIPVMMLQPFLENSIKHGFTNLKKSGLIKIIVQFIDDKYLHILIEDNGIGRSKSIELKHSNDLAKSFGIQITQDRLFYLNAHSHHKGGIIIKDIIVEEGVISGTSVEFKLPYQTIS